MEPEDAFKEPPVYKYDQVVTQQDLKDALAIMLDEYDNTPAMYMLERDRMAVAIKTLDMMLIWLEKGKPDGFEGLI